MPFPLLVSAEVSQVQRQVCLRARGPLKKTQLTHPQTGQCSFFFREASVHFPFCGTNVGLDFRHGFNPILCPSRLICPGYGCRAWGYSGGGHRVTGTPLSSQDPHVLVPEDAHAESV